MTRRILHLRHPEGFSDDMFKRFESGCSLFRALVETTLSEWTSLPDAGAERVIGQYQFSAPELSGDRRIVSLPIDGTWTLGSRAAFENASAYLLRAFLPTEFKRHVEEGLTESGTGDTRTHWRRPSELLDRALAITSPFPTGIGE